MIHNKDRQKKQFLNFFSKTTGLRTDVIFVWVLSFDLWYKHNSNTYGFYFFLSFFLFFYSCSAPSKSISISPLSIQCAICIQYNMKRCITNTIIGCKRLLLPNRYAVVDLTYAHYTDYSPINSTIICNENSWIIFFFFCWKGSFYTHWQLIHELHFLLSIYRTEILVNWFLFSFKEHYDDDMEYTYSWGSFML